MKIKLTCTNCVEPDSNVEQGTNKVAQVLQITENYWLCWVNKKDFSIKQIIWKNSNFWWKLN